MKNAPAISQFGDHGILIQFQGEIQLETNQKLAQLTHHLLVKFARHVASYSIAYIESVIYLHPEIAVKSTLENIKEEVNEFHLKKNTTSEQRVLTIPVCYETLFALDIEELAKQKNMKVSKLIELHTAPVYPVYFIGFAPGFPYMSGMNKKLAHPRKAKPREQVEAGSVGIAGEQTGVYPNTSPGGWNIIGRSPIQFFNLKKESPSLLRAGDLIQFKSITKKEFSQIEKQVREGTYKVQKAIKND
ncbi:allophanate hydrolase subunit 1 [Brumimicrobium salinarum]|uniref:Allophanate hydrolase subunit 1 n=1 Tax=Brumimicrobium salinarum TaxID=2058658 RepID=A0A2I0R5S7_9FLAO|nr:5-oxoprolinase subunit PxpB [Brumimicrobium salinarum]PKR81933.1 allophanate hydrolase subunit 1 [Brumimicrobium salinarum]